MPLPKSIRWLFYGLASLLGLILLLLVIVSFFRIPVNLEGQKGLIESITADALDRQVSINGAIKVTTSLWPVFIIEDVQVKNPSGFADGDFARLRSARIEIGLIRLLLGRIRIKDFEVDGLELSLQVDDRSDVNWVINDTDDESDKPEEPEKKTETEPESKSGQITSEIIIIDRLQLRNIAVSYHAPGMDSPKEFIIDTCDGSALPGEAFRFILAGSTLDEPYEVSIQAASLQEFIEENRSWVDIEAKIAKARIKFSGNVDLAEINRSLQLKLEIKGEGLENFNRLLGLDLPPFSTYGLNASLAAQKGILELTDLNIHVSNSQLTGSMKIDNVGSIPEVFLTLHSPMVQINDFVFDNWSPIKKDADTDISDAKAQETPKIVKKRTGKVPELLNPDSLARINASLTVSTERVLSGEDQLGSGKISAALQDGRISLDPVELNIPGGALSFSMSVKPGRESSEGTLKVLVENFDFGVIARRADPSTSMGGIINIDIDLTSSANDFTDLLAQGNGYLDFSAKPKNLQAGIMDLWALNVISAIVSQAVKGKSHIEFILGRWSMKDGYLEPDVFVIDTTRMRICGSGGVNFKTKKLNLEVAPSPKKPEFFSLATPINIQGSFEDFGLGIAPGGLIGTGIKFVVSPLQVPLQSIFDKPIPADASDLMAVELGPGNRDVKRPVGCRWFSTWK